MTYSSSTTDVGLTGPTVTDPRTRARRWVPDALGLSTAMIASTVFAFVATGIRVDTIRKPIGTGDTLFYYSMTRGLLDHRWFLHNPSLGWPFGNDLRLFPEFEYVHFALLKLIGVFDHNAIAAMNIYFLVGFPLAALTSYAFIRVLGVRPALASPLAMSYALLPWHIIRTPHTFLAAYWTVPPGLMLCYLIAGGRWDDFVRRAHSPSRRRLIQSGAVAAALVATAAGIYYALMISFLGLLCFGLRGRPWRGPSVVPALALTVPTVLFLAIARLQEKAATGPLDAGGYFRRFPGEAEKYGGKLTGLLLPWPGTPGLGRIRSYYEQYSQVPSTEASFTYHGVIAVAGTWLLLLYAARLLLLPGSRTQLSGSYTMRWLSGMSLLLMLTFVATGFSALAALVIPDLRSWNRYSIFIALLATAALGLAVQSVAFRAATAPKPRTITPIRVCVGVLLGVLVLVDQVLPRQGGDVQAGLALQFASSQESMETLDRAVQPDDCPVLQWPVGTYPESPAQGTVGNYEQLIPYLAGSNRPWSFGGIRGTLAGDWPGQLDDSTAARLVAQAAASGFCVLEVMDGAVVNRQQDSVAHGLAPLLGNPVVQDTVNNRRYFDLRAQVGTLQARVGPDGMKQIREGTLYPVLLRLPTGSSDGQWTTSRSSALEIVNPSSVARHVTVSMVLTANADNSNVQLGTQHLVAGTNGVPATVTVDVAAHSMVRIPVVTDSPADPTFTGTHYLEVGNLVASYDRGPLPTAASG